MKYLTTRLVLLLLVVGAGLHVTRSYGGEVAILYTTDSNGHRYRTNLWVIAQESSMWIRSNTPNSPWLDRIINNPEVELRRGKILKTYRATPLTHKRSRVNAYMAETYGWAEWVLAKVEDRSEAVPVFLDPFG